MASELSKLMKQYGVSSATMALPAQFKGTVVNEPTAPDKPVAPDAFTMTAPVVTDYGLASSIKAMPTKLAKGQTQADLDAAQESWRQYQTALSDFNAKKTAYDDTKKTYATYTSGDVKDKSSYAYQQKQYQDALGKYKNYLDDKTSFDTSKGDAYNTYKTAYQDRIAQTPMYLQQQFTRASDVNPYEGMYSPYGSIDNYNKTGTYWNDVIGDPTYTGAYTPYTPLYKQKGFADQASYEATLPEYLDNKNSQDSLSGGDTKVPSTIVDTKVPSTIVDTNAGNNTLTSTPTLIDLTNYTYAPSSQQQLEDQAVNAGYQGDYTDTAAMQGYLKAINTNVPSLTDLAVKNGVKNDTLVGSQPTSNIVAGVGTNPALRAKVLAAQAMNSNAGGVENDALKSVIGKDSLTGNTVIIGNNTLTGTPTLIDLAVKNGVTNTGTQQISNTTPADKTTASLVSQPNVIQQSQMTPWDNMGITQDDYYESYYAKGGSVHHLAKKYAVGGGVDIADSAMPNPEQGIPQPVEAPVAIPMAPAQAPPQSDSMVQMQEMLKAYGTPSNDYAQELEEARRKSNAETEAFMSMIQKSRKPENDNLSQAELYFRLAAAAGAPTKTGGIAESLSNINREMSDYSKEQVGRRNSDLELQMKAQQLKAANAKEDLNVLRGLAGESMKDKRALISEMIKAEIPKAQSEAGKLALDMGLKVGTPDYQKFVTTNGMQLLQAKVNQMIMGPAIASQNAATSGTQANISQERYDLERLKYLDKQEEGKKLTANDRKVLWEKEDTLNNLKNAQKMIEQAYDLNNVAYTGNLFDVAKQKYGEVFSPEDPTVVNTGKLVNLLSTESLSRMKDVFGSNPTEGERAAQAQLSGALAKSKEVRKDIMLNYMEQLQKRMALEEKRLKQLNEGTSRDLPSKEEAQ